jgi:CheY-like chemotaxis protein
MQDDPARQARAHVLVLENDPDVRALIDLVLQSAGYDGTLVARDAEAAWFTDVRPDVVLCDPFGPSGVDGALLKRLTATPATRNVPVILCTGAVHLVDTARAQLGHRAVAALPKPFDLDDLLACIERVRAAPPVG